ncbi:MAG: ShlB/FhaC/HecB family hemolysin secretion/activation protein [Burkholderiaceae bacterium]|nr:ShlB/FhaC/HecB family hemolysin secretion/activation protein [Burkholderiaceae bacterium]
MGGSILNGHRPVFAGLVTVSLLGLAATAHAQVPPVDAGSLLQEVERQRPAPAAPREGPALNVPPLLEPSAAPTAEFTVKQFTFTGNTKVRSSTLEAALANYLNRPIQFKDLQEATNVVADTYAKEGWLARAFIPRQDITEGTVRIHIIEAVYGGSKIQGEFNHAPSWLVQGTVDGQNAEGDVLSLTDVERGLLLADDLPGVSVVGSLTAGENTQETDVLISVEDTPWITGRVQIDNQGNKSTGENEISLNAAINGLTGHADQLTAYGLYTEGLSFVSVGYSIPLNYSGLRLAASYSTLGYRIVDSALFASGQDRGTGFANTWGFEATQPIVRSRNTNVYARLGYTNKLFDNRIGQVTTSEYTVDVVSLGITATHLDSFGGGGYTTLTLNPSIGNVDYGQSPDVIVSNESVAATSQTNGQYAKLRYGLSRQQNLPANFSLYANWRGQIASKNLDSSERFYLGGPYGVRAYPNNEGGGAQGNLLSLELRYNLMPELQFAAFYDVGNVQVNKFNDHVAAADPNNGTLQGAGLSVSWTAPYNIIVNATWAFRIGNNPFTDDPSQNQDGSSSSNRFWLNASIGF